MTTTTPEQEALAIKLGLGTQEEFLEAGKKAVMDGYAEFAKTPDFDRAYDRFIASSDFPKSVANAQALGDLMADTWAAAFTRGMLHGGRVAIGAAKKAAEALAEESAADK